MKTIFYYLLLAIDFYITTVIHTRIKLVSDLVISLESPRGGVEGEEAWSQVKTFYLSCTNEQRIREQGYTPLVNFLRATFPAYLDPHAISDGDLTDIVIGEELISSNPEQALKGHSHVKSEHN
jgi:hypothetical protein